MKTNTIKVLLVAGMLALPWFTLLATGQEYKFLRESQHIKLFYRWIPQPGKEDVREVKAVFYVNASSREIVSLLKNDKQALNWMKGAKEYRLLRKENEAAWYAYIQYSIPWPLNNQDCILHYTTESTGIPGDYILRFSGVPDYLPGKEGVKRMQNLAGLWKITAGNKGACTIEYYVCSYQQPLFPRWMTDPLIQGNLISTLQAFKQLAESKG